MIAPLRPRRHRGAPRASHGAIRVESGLLRIPLRRPSLDDARMTDDHTMHTTGQPLRRSCDDRMVAGVAGGIAQYLDVDPIVVRVGIAALTVLGGAGIPLYAAAWLLIPEQCSNESVAEQLLHRHRIA
jgi:phage shock protein PspC (stress-responsive transcriptional regulator)